MRRKERRDLEMQCKFGESSRRVVSTFVDIRLKPGCEISKNFSFILGSMNGSFLLLKICGSIIITKIYNAAKY